MAEKPANNASDVAVVDRESACSVAAWSRSATDCARAALLVVKPKLSKEERLQRRQMRDAMMLKRMLNRSDCAPSHAAELRAMASRA